MATEAQINANRQNAQKSTGPKTVEGKEASSQNAFRHGLFAKKPVVRGESREQYDRHREAMLADWNPVGEVENIVAERLVNLSWRLERAQRMQDQAIDYLGIRHSGSFDGERFEKLYRKAHDLSQSDELPVARDHILLGRLAVDDWSSNRVVDRMMMYERRIESSMYRAMRELERFQKARKAEQDQATCRGRRNADGTQGRDGLATNDNRDEPANRRPVPEQDSYRAKQSQPALSQVSARLSVIRSYGDKPPADTAGNKANQSQIDTQGRACCSDKGEVAASGWALQ